MVGRVYSNYGRFPSRKGLLKLWINLIAERAYKIYQNSQQGLIKLFFFGRKCLYFAEIHQNKDVYFRKMNKSNDTSVEKETPRKKITLKQEDIYKKYIRSVQKLKSTK